MQNIFKRSIAIAAVLGVVSIQVEATIVTLPKYQAQMIEVEQSRAIKDNYIVVFNTPSVLNISDDMSIQSYAVQQGDKLANLFNVSVKKNFGSVLNGILISATEAQIKLIRSDPSVKYIEQDSTVTVDSMVSNEHPAWEYQNWGRDRIDQRLLPLDGNYDYNFDGTGVTVYIMDSGVLTSHFGFGGRASSGYDFYDNDYDASTQCNGHGTHVAGIVGDSFFGVANNVNIVSVRVRGCSGRGPISAVLSALDWVKNNAQGPSVVNYSSSSSRVSRTMNDAFSATVDAGIPVVASAGNRNKDACGASPASASNVITVGSTTISDSRSWFSSYGDCVDIYAPGTDIVSTWHTTNFATKILSGTSMAAPHVAGVVALYLDEMPSLSPSDIDRLLSDSASTIKIKNTGFTRKLVHSYSNLKFKPVGRNPKVFDEETARVASLVVISNKAYSNGVDQNRFQVTVKDNYGLPVPGALIGVAFNDRLSLVEAANTLITDAKGSVTFGLRSMRDGKSTVIVETNGTKKGVVTEFGLLPPRYL